MLQNPILVNKPHISLDARSIASREEGKPERSFRSIWVNLDGTA